VRSHVKAVMTGEGADELFAGYPYFTAGVLGGRRAGIAQQLANWSQLLGSRQFVSGFLAVPREKDVNRLVALFGCVPIAVLWPLYSRAFEPRLPTVLFAARGACRSGGTSCAGKVKRHASG
jgi:hypothetical protein